MNPSYSNRISIDFANLLIAVPLVFTLAIKPVWSSTADKQALEQILQNSMGWRLRPNDRKTGYPCLSCT